MALREKTKKLEEEVKRTRDLEHKCKLMEETIKARNPNNIPMMLQAIKETTVNQKQQDNELKDRVK